MKKTVPGQFARNNKDNSARFVTKETYHHFYLNRLQVELLVSLFFFSNTNGHIYYRDIMDSPEHFAITLRVIRTYTFFMYSIQVKRYQNTNKQTCQTYVRAYPFNKNSLFSRFGKYSNKRHLYASQKKKKRGQGILLGAENQNLESVLS